MIELQKKIVLPWAMVDYYKYIDNKQLYACLVGCCLMLDECVTINKRLSIFSLPSILYRWIVERCMDSLFLVNYTNRGTLILRVIGQSVLF